MDYRTGFNYQREAASHDAGLDCNVDPDTGEILPSRTQQSFAEECDINNIMKRFGLTGQLPADFRTPLLGDFTDVLDYKSALNAVIEADDEFMKLDANVRERFNNDPQRLMEFLDNEKNFDEAVKLGIFKKPAEVEAGDGKPAS